MPSQSEGPGIWLSVWRFLLTQCLYERAAEVLARLRGCAGSPEPSLLALAISTKFAWRGPTIQRLPASAHRKTDLSRLITNQQNGMCAQRRLRLAWASAPSDLSLHWAYMQFYWFYHEAAQMVTLLTLEINVLRHDYKALYMYVGETLKYFSYRLSLNIFHDWIL